MSVVNDNATLAATIAALEQLPLEDAMAAFHQLQSRYRLTFVPTLRGQVKSYVRDEWSQMVRDGLCYGGFVQVTPTGTKRGAVQLDNVNGAQTALVYGVRVSVETAIPAAGASFSLYAFGPDELDADPPTAATNLLDGSHPEGGTLVFKRTLDVVGWDQLGGAQSLFHLRVGPGENAKSVSAAPELLCIIRPNSSLIVECDTADCAFSVDFLFALLDAGSEHL